MFIKDEEYLKLFKEVISKLPVDKRQWYYGYNSIKHLLPKIDKMTEIFLELSKQTAETEFMVSSQGLQMMRSL